MYIVSILPALVLLFSELFKDPKIIYGEARGQSQSAMQVCCYSFLGSCKVVRLEARGWMTSRPNWFLWDQGW